jgi:hypothetical protein
MQQGSAPIRADRSGLNAIGLGGCVFSLTPQLWVLTAHRLGRPALRPQHLQMLGMHGTVAANYAVDQADLLVALGVRFDDRVTGRLDAFASRARIVHVGECR